ncbi:hypothetical protein K3163_10200 [Qipengyuania sp. 1NDW9]|uniref:hypothetical protein n=1 Tax=Qipengyuania xiapuensis TaxID=2867236 RepID=UPI001C87C868|nr:hypothetical protein [Qipengyuania xiapuensis]MBX7493579.1 hypothetical protein [Qipengyuania xiapuensis]
MAIVIAALSGCATTPTSVNETDCYDLKVRAKAIGQFPTPFPNDPNYIVISWPWFVDLEVARVIDGRMNDPEISALAVLHSRYVDKTLTWFLRENTLGEYNILRLAEPEKAKKCAPGVVRPEPYLRPSEGETLASLRQAAIAEWEAEMEAEEQWLRENSDVED